MSQIYIKPSTTNRSNVHPTISAKRDRKLYDSPQLTEPKRVKLTLSNETDDRKRSSDQKDKQQEHDPKNTEGSLSVIDAVNKGLRRSSRLNPEIKKGEELVAL